MIAVRHNIEVAHRLIQTKGKCEQIHGHSMWVTLYVAGNGIVHGREGGVEYGELKTMFRKHLDEVYDHHILLNKIDPWAMHLGPEGTIKSDLATLPGLRPTAEDPTTENIARWILEHIRSEFGMRGWGTRAYPEAVEVWETHTNMARAGVA